MTAVIFDLYGTLIEEVESDYDRALQWLADAFFDAKFEKLKMLSLRFKENYLRMRALSDAESSFRRQLEFFEAELGCDLGGRYRAVEAEFIYLFRKERPIDGAESLLCSLHTHEKHICVLTNSLFSGENLKAYLVRIGIPAVIESVYSSADIGRRKPSKEAFQYVMSGIGVCDPRQVVCIGDSYEKDYLGALRFGMRPIFVSPLHEHADIAFENLRAVERYLSTEGLLEHAEEKCGSDLTDINVLI